MNKLDLTKPVQTRDGRPVRILCTDARREDCIIGLINENGKDQSYYWYPDGSHWHDPYGPRDCDLINVPPPMIKREGWINLYRPAQGDERLSDKVIWATEQSARVYSQDSDRYLMTLRIEWEEPSHD